MPQARDRLLRQDDVVAAYHRRRVSRSRGRDVWRGSSVIFVLEDENEASQVAGTPFRWRGAAMVGTPGRIGLASDSTVRSPRVGRRNSPIVGRENLSPAAGSGRGRGRGSDLPNWYPRRPLHDITAVARAIKRSTERRRVSGSRQIEGPILQGPIIDAQPEHDISLISPSPTIPSRRCCPPTIIGKVPKILRDITHRNDGDSGFLTPQKKLLNNIDMVEKVVMEELRKLERTPSAKREERRTRVRTLMSMR
ncbi:protein polychome [Phtheirospermum japonicum]|uniref:Protein polychome n=1 Tax=Phtheirospermum japonicum TaxID=374723 RepID=A0A830CDJ4_9LAMI|nr:protein polychome [Phtheirospermum japonicum]